MRTIDNNSPHYEALKTMGVLAMASILLGLMLKTHLLLYLGLIFLGIGVFAKKWSVIIASGWLKFAQVLGNINTRIILTIIFFGFLTPIAMVYRLLHGDFMNIRKRAGAITFFAQRDHEYSPEDLENPW
jgi:hypothetical protein